eukprot:3995760-Prymnesium_polylepis.1
MRQVFLQNDLYDGWTFWGYSLHQHKPISRAVARTLALADVRRADGNRTAACSDWARRAPLRMLVEHHYSRITTDQMISSFGPTSPLQQVAARCRCRVVLLTRLRQPLSFYISFFRWTVYWRQLLNASEFGATMLEWAPRNLQSAIFLRPLDATWAEYVGVHTAHGRDKRRAFDQFDGPQGATQRAELRRQLRAFDLVGLLERFDETLILLAEMAGLQRLLYRPEAPHSTGRRAMRALQPSVASTCPDWGACTARVRAVAPMDHAIYAEAEARFDRLVAERGAPFQQRLAAFRAARGAYHALPERRQPVVERSRPMATQRHSKVGMDQLGCALGDGFDGFDACRRVYADTPLHAGWRFTPRACCTR